MFHKNNYDQTVLNTSYIRIRYVNNKMGVVWDLRGNIIHVYVIVILTT